MLVSYFSCGELVSQRFTLDSRVTRHWNLHIGQWYADMRWPHICFSHADEKIDKHGSCKLRKNALRVGLHSPTSKKMAYHHFRWIWNEFLVVHHSRPCNPWPRRSETQNITRLHNKDGFDQHARRRALHYEGIVSTRILSPS